jgi:thioredoxin
MGEHTTTITGENFDAIAMNGNWVIDFWAEWCGPCKMMAPQFEAAAKELKGKVNFGKVDVDAESDLAGRFEIMSIPTLLFFKDGEQVNRYSGAMPKDEIELMVKESF